MNRDRRAQIAQAISALEGVDLESTLSVVSDLAEAEFEAFDNLPEGLQASDQGVASQEAADALQEAADALQEAVDRLAEAIERLGDATA